MCWWGCRSCALPLQCSASCGPGLRQRELKCGEKSIHGKLVTFPQRRCRNIKKPNTSLEEACNKGACPSQTLYNMVSGWYSSPWQQVGMGNQRWHGTEELPPVLTGPCTEPFPKEDHTTQPLRWDAAGPHPSCILVQLGALSWNWRMSLKNVIHAWEALHSTPIFQHFLLSLLQSALWLNYCISPCTVYLSICTDCLEFPKYYD